METRNLALTAYDNIDLFFTHRNIKRVSPKKSIDEFNKHMRSMGYIMIEGMASKRERLPDRNTIVVIISEQSTASRKKADFSKLIEQVRMGEDFKSGKDKNYFNNTDLIFISNEKPVNEAVSGYEDIISELHERYADLYIETYTYEKLIITPDNSIMPVHRIMNQKEVEDLNNDRLSNNSRRPAIPANDTAIVWLGARPGDVIEIKRPSGTTGYSINYRVVK